MQRCKFSGKHAPIEQEMWENKRLWRERVGAWPIRGEQMDCGSNRGATTDTKPLRRKSASGSSVQIAPHAVLLPHQGMNASVKS